MKLVYALTLLALPLCATANAAGTNRCGQPLPCGKFSGAFVAADGHSEFSAVEESMQLSPGQNPDELKLSGSLDEVGGKRVWAYEFVIKFGANRTITFYKGDTLIGTGMCSDTLCGYTMRPANEGNTAGTFSVKDGAILRSHANHNADGTTSLALSTMLPRN